MALHSVRNLRRRGPTREPKRRFHVYCEGRNTEPDYLRALATRYPGALIQIVSYGGVGTPGTIAKQASEHRRRLQALGQNEFERDDQVWAVFDHDEHPDVASARERCRANKIGVGYSNPCFEVWLILHHEDFERPDDRHAVQGHLRSLCHEYDPGGAKTLNCEALVIEVEKAEKRAEQQLRRRAETGQPHGRPSTTVGELTRAIREAAEKFRPKAAVDRGVRKRPR